MKKYTLVGAVVICVLGAASPVLAQDDTSGGPTPSTPAATQVPIDGGASLLLASGVAFGLKKLRNRRKAR